MYTLIRAYGVKKTINSLWVDQDVTGLTIQSLLYDFTSLYLELSNPFITGSVYVSMDALRDQDTTLTLDAFFAANPNVVLGTVDAIPTFRRASTMYMDATRAGYHVDVAQPGRRVDDITDRTNRTEIVINRTGTSPKDLHDYCLVTVNGFLHMTDYDEDHLYVPSGGQSLLKSRRGSCGINSFERIGKLNCQRILAADISPTDASIPLHQQFIIQAPASMRGKPLMLSLGGYLVTPEANVMQQISDDLWLVNMQVLDYIARYFESKDYVDFSSLELTEFPKDPNKVSLIELSSDEVTMRYLTLVQSFFISVDAERLTFTKHFVKHAPAPNRYIAYSNPTQALFLGRGRQADYWKNPQESVWEITVEDGYYPRFTRDHRDRRELDADSNTNSPYRLYENSRAYMLEIVANVPV